MPSRYRKLPHSPRGPAGRGSSSSSLPALASSYVVSRPDLRVADFVSWANRAGGVPAPGGRTAPDGVAATMPASTSAAGTKRWKQARWKGRCVMIPRFEVLGGPDCRHERARIGASAPMVQRGAKPVEFAVTWARLVTTLSSPSPNHPKPLSSLAPSRHTGALSLAARSTPDLVPPIDDHGPVAAG